MNNVEDIYAVTPLQSGMLPEELEIRPAALPRGDEALADLCLKDPLGRSRYGRLPENDFDREWVSVFHLLRDGEPVGGIRLEAARLFTLLPQKSDPQWQHFRFGALVEFPLVVDAKPEVRRRLELELLAQARDHADEVYPGMPLFCLLLQDDNGSAAVLREAGFERLEEEICIDRKLLSERGLPVDCGPATVYRFTPASPPLFDPLFLTANDEHLKIFSNEETKVRLVPTREFWSALKAYTTFSAYPLIRSFLRKVLSTAAEENIALVPRPRVLVAPCAAGDFLRFWPAEQPIEAALAVDIREDCRKLARRRLELPEIDQLNLALSYALSAIVDENRVSDDMLAGFALIVDRLHETNNGGKPGLNLATESALRLFARSFDEVLLNHAVPDWYFPIKMLARSLGLEDSIDLEVLVPWLAGRNGALADAKVLSERMIPHAAVPSFNDASLAGMDEEKCELGWADLTQSGTLPSGMFHIALCWEFIHVFHSQEQIDQFLDLLISRVHEGGVILISCIRETERKEPEDIQELYWALEFFRKKGLACKFDLMEFAEEITPFKRRLRHFYPFLIVKR